MKWRNLNHIEVVTWRTTPLHHLQKPGALFTFCNTYLDGDEARGALRSPLYRSPKSDPAPTCIVCIGRAFRGWGR
jgi:hypothetical protein